MSNIKQYEKYIDRYFDQLESEVSLDKVRMDHGNEQYTYEATPTKYIFDFIDQMNPKSGDVVYDLGSGYGKVIIISSLISKAQYRGLEIVPERVIVANKIVKKMNLKNASFKCANVLKHKLDDGNIFYLFNPFCESTLEKVSKNLELISKKKQIKIATWGGQSNRLFRNLAWLDMVKPKNMENHLVKYFISR